MRFMCACVLTLSLICASGAVQSETVAIPREVAATSPNKVDGISLPSSFSVNSDELFVSVKAESKSLVEWLVIVTVPSTNPPTPIPKVKYKVVSADKELTIGIPNVTCVLSIFCWGVLDGKPTKAARCDINVTSKDSPKPQPKPDDNTDPKPKPAGPFLITIIEDPLKRSADNTLITKWADNKVKLKELGHSGYLVSSKDRQINDPANGFADLMKKIPLPILVIQTSDGELLGAGPAPKTIDELIKMINQGK